MGWWQSRREKGEFAESFTTQDEAVAELLAA